MNEALERNIIQAMQEEFSIALDESALDIMRDMGEALKEHARETEDSGKEFTYRVGATLELTPRGDDCKVGCKVSWSIKRKFESIGRTVSNQPGLFDKTESGE